MIAASLVLLTLLAGIAGTTIGLLGPRTTQPGGRTVGATHRSECQDRDRANPGRAELQHRPHPDSRFGHADQSDRDRASQPETRGPGGKQALDKAREAFDQFRECRPDDITIMKQAALLHRFAANVSRGLTDYPAAMAAYAAAVQISEELIGRFPEDRRLSDELALTLSDRSGVERMMGKSKEATATLERALKLAEGPQGKLTDSAYRRTIAMVVMDQYDLAFMLGRFADAARFAVRGGELWELVKTAHASERLSIDPLFAAMAVHKVALADASLAIPRKRGGSRRRARPDEASRRAESDPGRAVLGLRGAPGTGERHSPSRSDGRRRSRTLPR